MGRAKAKKGPKYAVVKKLINRKTIQHHKEEVLNPAKKDPRNVPYVSSALFFKYNTALGPPYTVLVDTNFINFPIQNKVKIEKKLDGKEYMRTVMLKHEEIFGQQVYELHRLYEVQKILKSSYKAANSIRQNQERWIMMNQNGVHDQAKTREYIAEALETDIGLGNEQNLNVKLPQWVLQRLMLKLT
ncbi:hypothetical protein Droror1_Dr00027645 [Drosera rotundifolia]